VPIVPTVTIDSYINTARSRVAVDGECVRAVATAAVGNGLTLVPMSSLGITTAAISGAFSVRQGALGNRRLDIRSWEWFSAYYLSASPTLIPRMGQLGEGQKAILYFLSVGGVVSLDVVAEPIALANDTTVEAIPYPWTDAVPFYAAWLSFMQLQRQADADMMMARYKELMRAARQEITPTVLPEYRPGGAGAVGAAVHQPLASGMAPARGG